MMELVEGGGMVLQPADRNIIRMGDIDVVVLGSAEISGGQFSLLQTAERTPGDGPPLHVHRNAAESFYVLSGAYSMHLNGRDFSCPAGSFIYIPAGMAHTFHSLEAHSSKLNLYTPAAMEGYFSDLAEAIRTGVDESGLAEIAERYEVELLGPAQEGYLSATD